MIIPIGDDNSRRVSFPTVTLLLIAANAVVFFLELQRGDAFVDRYSFVPSQVVSGSASAIWTVFTALFLHAGWAHLLGNMLYLYVFGDNVEDALGKGRFFVFYIVCGVAGSLAQIAIAPDSMIPNLGASGAISGVLAGYLFLYPKNKVKVLVFFFIVNMSAWLVLGLWIATQAFAGFEDVAHHSIAMHGGVAYMAHIGGFVAGAALLLLLKPKHGALPQPEPVAVAE